MACIINLSSSLKIIYFDYTEGKSVQEMVNEALRRIPNNNG